MVSAMARPAGDAGVSMIFSAAGSSSSSRRRVIRSGTTVAVFRVGRAQGRRNLAAPQSETRSGDEMGCVLLHARSRRAGCRICRARRIIQQPAQDTTDGLRGFEITDADGYVLFFGRPREMA
jgi:hypothetical protein